MGPHYYTDNLSACEDKITRNCEIIVDPPSNFPVDTTPLFDPNDGSCTAKFFSFH